MNDVMSQNFATRADLEQVRTDLVRSIEKVRIDLEQKIDEKFETLYRHLWMMGIGIVLANVTLVAAAVALLGHKIG